MTARATTEEIGQAASLQAFIISKQQRTLGALPEAVTRPGATLLQSYVEEGIPDNTGLPRSRSALDKAIRNGSYDPACAPDMFIFIQGGLRWQVLYGFSILLSAEDAVRLFREKLKLLHIVAVPQAQRRPRLTLNLSTQPDKETSSANSTMDMEIAPESMQFGRDSPHIFQAIWVADPKEGPVQVSKLDVTDAYHRVILHPSQVGAFSCVVPSVPDNDVIILCIDLVVPMGWVDSPKFF